MGNAFLLIVVGLILFYLVVSDKWFCVEGFLGCLLGQPGAQPAPNPTALPTPGVTNPFPTNVNWGYPNVV